MPRRSDGPKPKRGFMDGYKKYDPRVEGYGSRDQWRHSWEGMTAGEAQSLLGRDDPLAILGLTKEPADEGELKSAYRKASLSSHPDKNPDDPEAASRFRKVNAAFVALKNRCGF